jgi:hypothetical protein
VNTDELIARLAAEPAGGVPRPAALTAALALVSGLALTVALFSLGYGPRPGLTAEIEAPFTLGKTLLALALGLLALPACLSLARPGQDGGTARRALWLVPAVGAVLAVMAFAGATPAERLVQFIGHSIAVCLPSILLLSMPLTAGLLVLLRRGAPEHPVRCGALAGLAAAGFATTLYSLYCTEDSPLFYVPWYGTGILMATGLGALAGHRWLRW